MLARRQATPRAQVVQDEGILGGTPCVSGTRIPAATVLAYLQVGYQDRAIREDYPTLPLDGIEAVIRWASEHGLDLGRRAEVIRLPQG